MTALLKAHMEFGLLILSVLVWFTEGAEFCTQGLFTYTYCEDGYYCCNNDTQCCPNVLSVGVIVGIVIGCLVGLGFLIAFCVVCICGYGKSHGSSGNVITPNTGAPVQVISTGYTQPAPGYAQHAPGASGYGYGAQANLSQPPAYQQPLGAEQKGTVG